MSTAAPRRRRFTVGAVVALLAAATAVSIASFASDRADAAPGDPPMSIGNRIWLDDSSDPAQWGPGGSRTNSLIDATDDGNLTTAGVQNPGLANVDLQLWSDANNSTFIDSGDSLVASTTTDSNGYYLFSGLAPGNYLVRVPATEFTAGQPLNGLVSSFDAVAQVSPTNATDSNDNGADAAAAGPVDSRLIELVSLAEPTGESDPSVPALGPNGETDDNSDLTIDFSFVRPPMSIGNHIWLDDHSTNQALRGNGIFDSGELGIAGVEVALYRDLDADGAVDAGEDTGLRDTTDASGFYLFANIPPGDYIVAVAEANFTTGGPLQNSISSRSTAPNPTAADNGVDNNDNGRDTAVSGVGILSSKITLSSGSEPTSESLTNDPADGVGGRGGYGIANNSSDLSVDFGFYTPMSLGNRVWIDDSNTSSTWSTTRNNGVRDTADDLDNPNIAGVQGTGVAGVTLRLYRDLDADGVVDPGEDSGRTTTTNSTGYYLFDGLTRGNYIVGVEFSNFGAGSPLFGFTSSFTAAAPTDNSTDNTDDGAGTAVSSAFGVISPTIALSYTSATAGGELVAEADPTPQFQANRGANGELDSFSDLTIDFGFSRLAMSLGNKVWLDDHPTNPALRGNGLLDSGESGVAGVEVALYRDLDADGNVDAGEDTGLRDSTDASGFYLFSNLPAASYIVAVTEANFSVGEPLEGLISSTVPVAADNQTDANDNGIDTAVAGVGIISSRIQLVVGSEPTAETASTAPGDGAAGRGTHGELDADSDLTVDFGFARPSVAAGDFVWVDVDGDGVQDSGEPGIAGVSLAISDSNGDPVVDVRGTTIAAVTTDLDGAYRFSDLPLLSSGETYTVTIDDTSAALDGYWPTVTAAGTTATDSSTASAESSTLSTNGSADNSLDFGFVPAVAVGDYVWLDENRDGVQDVTENGIAGVSVTLLTAAGSPATYIDGSAATAIMTDADGHYVFTNLRAGTYRVQFGPVADHVISPTGAGSAATDSDADVATGITPVFTIATTATGDTRAPVPSDNADEARFINPTIDAGFAARSFDLALTKAFTGAATAAGTATWTLTVTNLGTDASADAIVVTDQLPTALAFVSGSGNGFSCSAVARAVTCTRATGLAPAASASFSLVTSYSVATADIQNSATVSGGQGDSDVNNDSSTATAPSSALRAPVTPTKPASKPPVSTVPAPQPTSTATPTPTPTPTATPSPSATPEPEQSAAPAPVTSGNDNWTLLAVILGALLLAGIVLAAVFIFRARRP